MEKEVYTCPCCGGDISEFVRQSIMLHVRRQQAAVARSGISSEKRAAMIKDSQARLKKWREENPEKVREKAAAASHARTPESFARQAQTVRETAQRKTMKFAELLFAAKESGREITPDVERELMEKARQIIKDENRRNRVNRKKAEPKAE